MLDVYRGDKGGNNTINLKGLDREASYLVSKIPVEQSNIIKGADLMNNGFDIKLRTYEAGLWYLKKLDKEMR